MATPVLLLLRKIWVALRNDGFSADSNAVLALCQYRILQIELLFQCCAVVQDQGAIKEQNILTGEGDIVFHHLAA